MLLVSLILLFFFTKVISFNYNIRAFLTGGNGILGNELIKSFIENNHNNNNCNLIYTTRKPYKSYSHCNIVKNQILDLESLSSSSSFSSFPVPNDFFFSGNNYNNNNERIILINNAGICLSGNDISTINKSLVINTIAPTELVLLLLNDERLNQLLKRDRNIEIVVINVSSGEGELLYLNNDIRSKLSTIDDLDALKNYVSSLQEEEEKIEIAFGDTPWYSLSKALLNHATVLLHKKYHNMNVRVVAVCPGDFISPMTSKYDLEVARRSNVREAADIIWTLALGKKEDYPSGYFYRDLKQISW